MMKTIVRSPVFIVGLVVGLMLGAAEFIGSGMGWRAILSGAIPIAYAAAVTIVARRSDSVSLLAGHPVDERAAHVSHEASTWAFGITAIAVVAAVAWQVAIGGDIAAYAAIAVVMAIAYLGSLLVVQTRH